MNMFSARAQLKEKREDSYNEILANSVKVKTVNLINDLFKTQKTLERNKNKFKKEFDEQFRKHFENIASLYTNSGNDKYYALSKIAQSIIKSIDSGDIRYLKEWRETNDKEEKKKSIIKWIDNKALKNNKSRILNLEHEEDPILFVFDKKLDAIIKREMKQNKKEVSEAGFIEIHEIDYSFKEIEKSEVLSVINYRASLV